MKTFFKVAILSLLLGVLICSNTAFPKIPTFSVEKLVKVADFIIIGKVKSIKEIKKEIIEGKKYVKINNVIIPEKVLKGDWKIGAPMIFYTYKLMVGNKYVWKEDELRFPAENTEILIFVTKEPNGELDIVNGRLGIWDMEGDQQPWRIQSKRTLKDVEEEIIKQRGR